MELDFSDLDSYLIAQKGMIIHQVWFGTIPTKGKSKIQYREWKKYRDSWKIKNPDWYHIEWDRKMCATLVHTFYPEHEEMFTKYSYEIQRCDAIRYFILHRYGGLYADMDCYCNKSWTEVLKEYPQDIYFVQTSVPNGLEAEYISNCLMYSKPNHPFWKYFFLELTKNQSYPYYPRHLQISLTTGLRILDRAYKRTKFKYRLFSYPYRVFNPYGIADEELLFTGNKEIYSVHFSKGSWHDKDTKFIDFFFRDWKFILFTFLVLFVPVIYSITERLKQ